MSAIYGTLKALNITLSTGLLASVGYTFTYRHFLADKKQPLQLLEILSTGYLLLFSLLCLLYDTGINYGARKYFGCMRDSLGRGLFHIWCAVALWTIYPRSVGFG